MPTTALSRYPVFRILVPFIAGILLQALLSYWWLPLLVIAGAIGIFLLLIHLSNSPEGRLRWRPYFFLPLGLSALALGWLAAIIHNPPHCDTSKLNGKPLIGRVVNLEYTDFSMRLTVDVLDGNLPNGKVLVSTRGCDYTMQTGDIVTWTAALNEVGNLGNPGEMDYAAYLLHSEGIRYQQHLPVGKVIKVGHSPTLFTRLATVRRDLQLKVFNTDLSPAAQQFVCAILLGNSNLIDKATRHEFSAAGVAHIMALSGLHVGFITIIIWWLLFPLDYVRMKRWRLVITLAAIVLFAIFTGLSPGVVRATVMIGFVFASLVFHRRSIAINALAMAALLILVFKPSSIYDVGFQLSFITVGAILLFARLPRWLESRYKWANYLTTTIITSVVALLATVALSAHYFHTVSLMSVLSNLLILPIMPVFMTLGAIFLLVTAAGLHWHVLDWALDSIYRYFYWSAGTVNAIPGSYLNGVYVTTFSVIAYFVVIALVILWLYRRSYRYMLAAGVAFAVLLTHSLWVDTLTPRQGLIMLNSFTSTPILYYNDGVGYAWIPDEEDPDSVAFARFHEGFIARQGINELFIITNEDSLLTDNALIKPPFAHLSGYRIIAAGGGRWKQATASARMPLDVVIVTKRFHGTIAGLRDLYQFKRLIVSSAHHEKARLQHECDSLGIELIEGFYEFK